jgi:hypothetical protein
MTDKIQIIDNGIYFDRRLVAELVEDLSASLRDSFISILKNGEVKFVPCDEQLSIPLEDK